MKLTFENARSEISDKYTCSELQNWLKLKYLQFSVCRYVFFMTHAISQLCKLQVILFLLSLFSPSIVCSKCNLSPMYDHFILFSHWYSLMTYLSYLPQFHPLFPLYVCVYTHTHTHTHIYKILYVYIYIYIYIYILYYIFILFSSNYSNSLSPS